ncbi:hypothetical protein [Apilactobacillus timberlakei]|uniref:Uncharacterized protein n=1 Tax=Apilactobacillus timberlakei TaxID=2008380 RepID=A0ABY2YRL9_9LACO|nr:hypothetical protein [Apilactobacillus timberlakei]TPR12757.1 hypothetical protein DY048_07035 [Apilactobacillus timberlakei]TPR13640.1 hypothetical protein DY052_07905 [Apilactobacillus timberlakei]
MKYLTNDDLAHLLHDHVQCKHEFGSIPDANLAVKVIEESNFDFKVIAAFYEDIAHLDDALDKVSASKIKQIIKTHDDEISGLNDDFYI